MEIRELLKGKVKSDSNDEYINQKLTKIKDDIHDLTEVEFLEYFTNIKE